MEPVGNARFTLKRGDGSHAAERRAVRRSLATVRGTGMPRKRRAQGLAIDRRDSRLGSAPGGNRWTSAAGDRDVRRRDLRGGDHQSKRDLPEDAQRSASDERRASGRIEAAARAALRDIVRGSIKKRYKGSWSL